MRNAVFLGVLALTLPIWAQEQGARQQTVVEVTSIEALSRLQPAVGEMFAEARAQQEQKRYARAIQAFSDLLRFYPKAEYTEESLHRIAECYRALGRFDDARATLVLGREKFSEGKWLFPGYLLEGEMLAADGKWKQALDPLQNAAKAQEKPIWTRALYLLTLAHENLGELPKARPYLKRLHDEEREKGGTSHRDFAEVKLGVIEAEAGDPIAALAHFKTVVARTGDASLRAEAAVRAGNLAYSREDYKKALGFYEVIRYVDAPEFWKALAHLGLLQANFSLGDYAEAVRIFDEVRPFFPEKARPQVFFLVAESYRLLDQIKKALAQYQSVLDQFPGAAVAEPSAWARLLLLQKMGSPWVLGETERFLERFPESKRISFVRLMRADAFYEKENYAACLPMYQELAESEKEALRALGSDVLGSVLFRLGRSAFEREEFPIAVESLEEFSTKNPKHELARHALWLLAQSQQALGDAPAARNALKRLIDGYPTFSQREMALWQAALLAANGEDIAATRSYLEQLLREFPKTERVAQAHQLLASGFGKENAKAAPHWEKARLLDPEKFFQPATQQLIRIYLEEKNLSALVDEVRAYDRWRKKNVAAPAVSLDVVEWIAHELTQAPVPARAEPYYRRVLARSQDRAQRKRARLGLAMLLSQLKNWSGAVREWQAYRAAAPDDADRSAVLEPLAQAYIGIGKLEEAEKLAEQILRQNPEGEYNARGRLLMGEVAFARKNYERAAKIFSAVALLIDHPELTPHAKARATESRMFQKKPK